MTDIHIHVVVKRDDDVRLGTLCGVQVPRLPDLPTAHVTRFELSWPLEERAKTIARITCEACKAVLVQEALQAAG